MKILEKRMTPFLILAMLSASADINLYSAEITTVTIRNNRVRINLERAKKIVFEHSKIHSNNAKLTKLILEKENKKYVYAIEFYYKNKRYRYNVDANTGKVITYSSTERLISDSRWGVGKDITFQAKNAPAAAPSPAPIEQRTEPDAYADMQSKLEFSKRITEEESYDRAKYNFSRKEKNVEIIILEQLKKNVYDDLNNASFEEIILVNAEKSIYKGTIKANYIEYNFKINLSTGEILKWKLKK
ncbi:PepSY domain-containing protein [Leptotrichia massiliensis]|uniref:PepSY domain-containing protein n=1 Tax=Leptotrichia massiliensis TaxID=1852388 RepID=UPI0008D9DCAA|nr:PepSY domain-containing protein [Leptotrichia massiliensis]